MKREEWLKLYGQVAEKLFTGVEEGFGKKMIEVKTNTTDFALLNKLRTNTYFFSAFKNFNLLQDLNALLLKDNGDFREYSSFKKEALKLNSQYNVNWLKTEYNTAVGSAQMAARWQEYALNADTHLLKYQTAGDDHVRPAHAVLDGIIQPVTSSFWDTYYPPWDWECRCDVTQVLKSRAKETDISKKDLPPVIGFLGNAGKSGQIFTKDHPYFSGISKADGTLVKKSAKEEVDKLEPKKRTKKK